ncbi:MAG: tail fiber domain-containing protein [Ferruginibacter sp.]
MKKLFTLPVILLSIQQLAAQNFAINNDGTAAQTTALLDVKSTTKGVLIPRMSKTEKNGIVAPATGLLIFQATPDSTGFYYYDGAQWNWLAKATASTAWSTNGNAGTVAATDFLGTTDNQPINFRQNNLWMGRLDNALYNYVIGDSAGSNLSGSGNIAIGRKALKKSTNSGGSVAVGDSALTNSTVAGINTAIGYKSMLANTTGTTSTAVGAFSLGKNTGGVNNTAVGYNAFSNGTGGSDNTSIGYEAGKFITSDQNTAVGSLALRSNTGGNQNNAFGYGALYGTTTGVWNVGIGNNAMNQNSTGNRNIAIGVGALYFNTYDGSTAIGAEAGAWNNRPSLTAVGDGAAYANSRSTVNLAEGLENTAVGYRALFGNSNGNKNTAVGFQALFGLNVVNFSISRNTAVGDSAMAYSLGSRNTAVGTTALSRSANSDENVAIGDSAMGGSFNTSFNVAVGYKTLKSLKAGANNTAIGYAALENDTIGSANTAIGFKTLNNISLGYDNVASGLFSLYSTTSGYGNIAMGNYSGLNNTTGICNSLLGYFSDLSTTGLTNASAFGWGAMVNASNKIRLGNSSVTLVETQTAFTTVSDGRFKEDVKEDVKGLDFINRLRPVTYHFNYNKFEDFLHPEKSNNVSMAPYRQAAYRAQLNNRSQQVETGFIAQEVEQAVKASGYHFNGVIKPQNENDNYSLDYSKMVVPLVKAVQELSAQNELIKKQNETLAKKNEQLEKDIQVIKIKLGIN